MSYEDSPEAPKQSVGKGDIDSQSSEPQDDRGHWGSRAEFVLACLGYSVGLGNLWRFPYLAYENGGAAFLLPYLVLLVAIGRPLYLMEVALGQYSQLGPLHAFKSVTPLMRGLGYAMVLKSVFGSTTYMVIISYSLHYLYNSIAYIGYELPWSTCDPSWTDEQCYLVGKEVPCSQYNLSTPTADVNCTTANETSSTQYWRNNVLQLDTEGIVSFGDLGSLVLPLVYCLLVGWVVTCLSLWHGIKSSGKVVYFTATFPFVVLLVLTVAGVRLPGAIMGLRYLFVPKWEKLLEVNVWRLAVEQVIFSLSIGSGGLITFGSYNHFYTKLHIDVFILSILDLIASMLCAVTVFSVLGAMAHDLGYSDIKDVVASGPGLAFIAYPEAIVRTLPMPHLWSALFFFMLFTLGLDSMFGMVEIVLTTVFDNFPSSRRHKPVVICSLSIFFFCCSLTFCTEKGQYVFHLLDVFNVGVGGLLMSLLNCAAINWVYGTQQFSRDLRFMTSYNPSWVMRGSWAVLAPLPLLALFIGSLAQWHWPEYAGTARYPVWAYAVGAAVPLTIIAPVVGFFLWHLINKATKGQWSEICQPSCDWGPGCPVARQRLNELSRLLDEARREQQPTVPEGGVLNTAFDGGPLEMTSKLPRQ